MKKALTCFIVQLLFIIHAFAGETWVARQPMPVALTSFGAVCVGNTIYVVGGQCDTGLSLRVFAYDIYTDAWTEKAPMLNAHCYSDVAAVGNKIYAIGGVNSADDTAYDKVDEYDIATDTWTAKASLPRGRGTYSPVVVDGRIYVFGGQYTAVGSDVIIYDPAADAWSYGTARATAVATQDEGVLMGGKCYLLGGQNVSVGSSFYDFLDSTAIYEPATGIWSSGPSMPNTRAYGGTALLNGRIYFMCGEGGGGDAHGQNNTNWYLDSATNTWHTALACLGSRSECIAVTAPNNKIYLLGGRTHGYSVVNWNHEYDPNAANTAAPGVNGTEVSQCIYPNPCRGNMTLRVRLPKANIQYEPVVVNMAGQLMNVPYRQQANELLLDISGLPRGVYVLHGMGLPSNTFVVE